MDVLNTLAPVFLVIALGAILRRAKFISDALIKGANRLVYWVGLPALLFHKLAESQELDRAFGNVFLITVIGMTACVAVGYLVAAVLRLPPARIGAFVQATFRGNLAYVGLAVIFFAFASRGGSAAGSSAQTAAILAFAPIVPIYNITAVVVLLAGRGKASIRTILHMCFQIVTNPLLLACVWGAGFSLMGFKLPLAAAHTLQVVGQFALPMALLCIGGVLVSTNVKGRMIPSILAAIIKVGVGPAVGFMVGHLLGAAPREIAVALILLACPTAVASYVLADQLGGDGALAAGAVVVSTILSIISLSVVVAMI